MHRSFCKIIKFRFLPLVVVAFIFSPVFIWGSPDEIPYRLDKATVDLVGDVHAEVCIWNDDIFIELPPSKSRTGGALASGLTSVFLGPLAGGLLGAIINDVIDSTKNKNSDSAKYKSIEKAVNDNDAMEIVAPLKAMIEDINFRAALHAALLPMVNELSWPHVIDLKDRDGSAPVSKKDFLNKVNEGSLLDIQCIYQLSLNAEVLKILTEFTLYLKGSAKAAVAGRVLFSSERIGKFEVCDEAIALWSEYDGAAFRQALDLGIKETIKMLKIALPSVGSKSALGPDSQIKLIKIRTKYEEDNYRPKYQGDSISAYVVEEKGNRVVLQLGTNSFISIPRSDIISENSIRDLKQKKK